MDVITMGQSTTIFLCFCFWPGDNQNEQPNEQLGDPSASLLLTPEKEVFCNKKGCIINREILQSMIREHGKHVKRYNLEDMFLFVFDSSCCCRIWNPTIGLHWKAITSSPTLLD